jgi:hypothetical protein
MTPFGYSLRFQFRSRNLRLLWRTPRHYLLLVKRLVDWKHWKKLDVLPFRTQRLQLRLQPCERQTTTTVPETTTTTTTVPETTTTTVVDPTTTPSGCQPDFLGICDPNRISEACCNPEHRCKRHVTGTCNDTLVTAYLCIYAPAQSKFNKEILREMGNESSSPEFGEAGSTVDEDGVHRSARYQDPTLKTYTNGTTSFFPVGPARVLDLC